MKKDEAIQHLVQYILETEQDDYINWIESEGIDESTPMAESHVYRMALIIKEARDN